MKRTNPLQPLGQYEIDPPSGLGDEEIQLALYEIDKETMMEL